MAATSIICVLKLARMSLYSVVFAAAAAMSVLTPRAARLPASIPLAASRAAAAAACAAATEA